MIKRGEAGLAATLARTIEHANSGNFREGAVRVLRHVSKPPYTEIVARVLSALEGPAPSVETPREAQRALDTLHEEEARLA